MFLLCQGQCCLILFKVCVVHYNIDECAPITQGWKFSPSLPKTSVLDLSHIIQRGTWVNSNGTAHMLKHVANILIISELDVCLIAFLFYSPILYKTFLIQFNYKNSILIAWKRKEKCLPREIRTPRHSFSFSTFSYEACTWIDGLFYSVIALLDSALQYFPNLKLCEHFPPPHPLRKSDWTFSSYISHVP